MNKSENYKEIAQNISNYLSELTPKEFLKWLTKYKYFGILDIPNIPKKSPEVKRIISFCEVIDENGKQLIIYRIKEINKIINEYEKNLAINYIRNSIIDNLHKIYIN